MKPLIVPKRFTVEQAKKTPAWEPAELGSKLVCMLRAKRILKRIEKARGNHDNTN